MSDGYLDFYRNRRVLVTGGLGFIGSNLCRTLADLGAEVLCVDSLLPESVNSVLEIVVDGLDRTAIEQALRAGLAAACRPGVVEISAGNYGGKLGKHHFHLHQLLS